MSALACRCAAVVLVLAAALTLTPAESFASQPGSDLFQNLDSLDSIPAPAPILVRPRVFAGYGALIAAAMLSILYLYRGRAFIVYWIAGWLLIAGSLALLARG